MDLVSQTFSPFAKSYYFIQLNKKIVHSFKYMYCPFCNIILVSVREPVFWKCGFYTELPLTVIIITLVIYSFVLF